MEPAPSLLAGERRTGTAGGSGTQGWGVVSGGGAETAAVPTHLCTHLTGQTLSAGAHLLGLSIVPPQRRTATARGSHWQPASTPRCCGFILQEALELVTRHRGIAWAGPGGREAPEEVPAGSSDCSGLAPTTGGPEHPALRAETGRSRCDLLESSTQSNQGHHYPPRGDTSPTQGSVSTQTRTSTAVGSDAGEGG